MRLGHRLLVRRGDLPQSPQDFRRLVLHRAGAVGARQGVERLHGTADLAASLVQIGQTLQRRDVAVGFEIAQVLQQTGHRLRVSGTISRLKQRIDTLPHLVGLPLFERRDEDALPGVLGYLQHRGLAEQVQRVLRAADHGVQSRQLSSQPGTVIAVPRGVFEKRQRLFRTIRPGQAAGRADQRLVGVGLQLARATEDLLRVLEVSGIQ